MAVFTRLGPSGGNGGNHFDDSTQLSQPFSVRLASIRVRSGSSIDSIEFVYEATDGSTVGSGPHGGGGGNAGPTFSLADGEHLVSIEGSWGNYVDFLILTTDKGKSASFGTYHSPGSSVWARPAVQPFPPNATNHFIYEAPPGFQIFAIWGNSGQLLDALGVVLRETNPPILKKIP